MGSLKRHNNRHPPSLLQVAMRATVFPTLAAVLATLPLLVLTTGSCPTPSNKGYIRLVSGDSRVGLYLSRNLFKTDNAVLMTTNTTADALLVSIDRDINPTPLSCLNAAITGFPFLGLSTAQASPVFGAQSHDYAAVTYITDPNVSPVKSVYDFGGPAKGLWFIGIHNELVFDWDHADGAVYRLRHSAEISTRRVYDVSNLNAYTAFYYSNNSTAQVEATLVFEPVTA